MWKRILSSAFVFILLITCLPFSAAAKEYRDYRDMEMTLSTPGLPQYIKCSFQYNTELAEIVDDYPGFEPDGFCFPMAEDAYDCMYDVDYQVEDGLINFEYTLKPGYDLEYLEDCLDRIALSLGRGFVNRGEGALHTLNLFHAAVCYSNRNWISMSPYKGIVHDMVLSDGTVMIKDGKRLKNATSQVYPNYLIKPDPKVSNVDKYRELTLSQYRLTADQLSSFDVIYTHNNEYGDVDWALVRAETDLNVDTPSYYEFGNRVLNTQNCCSPFAFNVGVYNAKRNRFFDITECSIEDYPDLEAVWTELGDGRLIGDMDGDNSLTVSDAVIIQRCVADVTPFPDNDVNPEAEKNPDAIAFFSDFDVDGARDVTDATMIQRYIADMPHRTAEWSEYKLPTEALHTPDDPSIPSITGFRSLGKGVEISIGTVPGAEKYRVYYKNENNNWVKMGETTGKPFIATNAVEVGKTYTYTVRCIKADLSEFTSDYDRTGWSYTYDPQLDTPKITRVEVVDSGIKITWDPVEGADQYRVYIKDNGWTKLADTSSSNYVHTITDPKDYYTYTVCCLSQNGKSQASAYDPNGTEFRFISEPSIKNIEAHLDGVAFTVEADHDAPGDIAVYRKNGSSWKRIGVVANGENFTDTDVTPGKSYTYTCRCLSADGSYFVSRFIKKGWTQSFTVDKCKPALEYFIYMGDDSALLQIKEGNKFNIPKFEVDFVNPSNNDDYWGTLFIEGNEAVGIRDDLITEKDSYRLYIVGLDENNNMITDYNEDGFIIKKLPAAKNLRINKIGDRKYRIRWDKSTSWAVDGYAIDLYSKVDEPVIFDEYVPYLYYDIDLSGYPEDTEWSVIVWTVTEDLVSAGNGTLLTFKESDFT